MLRIVFLSMIAFSTAQAQFGGSCLDAEGKDILDQPEVFQNLIDQSPSCYEATQLAQACAWGSSLDMSTAGLAHQVCSRELEAHKPSSDLMDFLGKMETTCIDKYKDMDGTLYKSMAAYCKLEAINWIVGIASPADIEEEPSVE